MDCPMCGRRMSWKDGVYSCKKCDLDISEDEIIRDPDEDDYDGEPECCAACGGDYPNCKSSCPIFDD